jgi:5-methylcytosine-specific restriction endonuclease McrA
MPFLVQNNLISATLLHCRVSVLLTLVKSLQRSSAEEPGSRHCLDEEDSMPYKNPEDRRAYFARTLAHRREVHRRWVSNNQAHRDAYMAEYQKTHSEEIAEKNRAYHSSHSAEISAKQRLVREADLDATRKRDREYARKYRAADPEKTRAKDRERRAKTGAHIDALAKARRLANPEPFRASDRKRAHTPARKTQAVTAKRRRRAAHANAPVNDLTHAQWLEIQAAQGHRCYYCQKRCKGTLTQDHIVPLSQGGSHTLHNVIGACKSCNSRKGTRKPPIPVQTLLLTVAPARQKVPQQLSP